MRVALLLLALAASPGAAQVLGGSDSGRAPGTIGQDETNNGRDTAPQEAVPICELATVRRDSVALFSGPWTARVLPGVLIFDGATQPSDPVEGIAVTLDPEARTASFEGEPLSARLLTRRAPLVLEEGQAYIALDDARKQTARPPCEDLDLPRIRVEGDVQQGEQVMGVMLYLEAVSETELVGFIQLAVSSAGSSQTSLAVHGIVLNR